MIITLLTDFGTADPYMAAVKGVILALAPDASVVDACHDIPAQDVRAAAWVLGQYWWCYPEGTIHVAVVDPGVGTERDILLVEADGHRFIAPDNGLLTWVLERAERTELRKLRPEVRREEDIPATFHGRDIFAHAAGLLASGRARPGDLAVPVSSVLTPAWALVQDEGERLVGEIVHVDHFGNLISNIGERQVREKGWTSPEIMVGSLPGVPLKRTYAEGGEGELIALFGSSGTLEIAVSGGSAAGLTSLGRGDAVTVRG